MSDVDGVLVETRRPGKGARVYLRAAQAGSSTYLSQHWPYRTADTQGEVFFTKVEGYFDVLVDANHDAVADGIARNVASGESVIVLISPVPVSTPPNSEPVTKPTDNTPPAKPKISGLWINGGVTVTTSYDVLVTMAAENAVFVAFSEQPPAYGVKVPFRVAMPERLSYGQGWKTLYALVYGSDGSFAGPVSASIAVMTHPPYPPDLTRLLVNANPPGSFDYLVGLTGAVEGGNVVRVYSDMEYQNLLAQIGTTVDGSFGPVSIGDGSAGTNVFRPGDLVFVTNVDIFGRESGATWIENDSTPPQGWNLDGFWENKYPPAGIGTRGETFYATYSNALADSREDQVGGKLFPPKFGSEFVFDIPAHAAQFRAPVTIPADLFLDYSGPVTGMAWDRAGNVAIDMSKIITPTGPIPKNFELNSAPPAAALFNTFDGGNRQLVMHWQDYNLDTYGYVLALSSETSPTVYSKTIISWEGDNFILDGLPNCHWYTPTLRVLDRGLNLSPYSTAPSAEVILPPPEFSAWGGPSDQNGYGMLYYYMNKVKYASRYELDFAEVSGPSYEYMATTGTASPVSTVTLWEGYGNARISELPVGRLFYLSARAFDGTCKSHYAPEVSADTDLHMLKAYDGSPDQAFGGALANAGDPDNDGRPDVAVGSSGARETAVISPATGALIKPLGYYFAPDDFDLPGTPVSAADVDGDGRVEIIVGSPYEATGTTFMAGAVRVFRADGTLLRVLYGDTVGLQYGYSTARIGDLNGDGADEFLVGSIGCLHRDCLMAGTVPTEGPSRVDIVNGATLLVMKTIWGENGDLFGAAVAGGFDFDRDGIPDYAVGAPGATGFATPYVKIFSAATGNEFSLKGPGRFGASIWGGDIGTSTHVIVGAVGKTDDAPGYAFDFTFVTATQSWRPGWVVDGAKRSAGPRFGASLSLGGLVNRDATPDILIGAPGDIQSFSWGAGSVFVVDSTTGRFLYEVRGSSYDGGLGFGTLGLPDLNGFPRAEWLVSAPGSAFGGYQSGRIYLFTTDP